MFTLEFIIAPNFFDSMEDETFNFEIHFSSKTRSQESKEYKSHFEICNSKLSKHRSLDKRIICQGCPHLKKAKHLKFFS